MIISFDVDGVDIRQIKGLHATIGYFVQAPGPQGRIDAIAFTDIKRIGTRKIPSATFSGVYFSSSPVMLPIPPGISRLLAVAELTSRKMIPEKPLDFKLN